VLNATNPALKTERISPSRQPNLSNEASLEDIDLPHSPQPDSFYDCPESELNEENFVTLQTLQGSLGYLRPQGQLPDPTELLFTERQE
jgi:hypothetical protein